MKSHVSFEQKVCLICGQVFDTGAILLDKRLQQRLELKTVTGWDLCSEHAKLWEEGYIALVECDPEKTRFTGNNIKPEDAYRTGRIAHIRKTVAPQIFNVEITGPVAFVEPGVIDKLEKRMQ